MPEVINEFLETKSYQSAKEIVVDLYDNYLVDMGMFTYQSAINPKTFSSNEGRNGLSCIFFENYVATKLINFGYKFFYWKGKGDSEFEFVIESESAVIPIDVKKSKKTEFP